MIIDAATAKILAALILTSTQGGDRLRPALPLQAIDRGSSWLVKGTPFVDHQLKLQYCVFSIFLEKSSARVLGINFSGRPILTDQQAAHWHEQMSKDQFDHIFGPPTVFEPDGRYLHLNGALYGGVINKPEDAISFAYVLMKKNPGLALVPKDALQAVERDKIWHVSASVPRQIDRSEIMSFSRYDAKIISGDL